MFRFENDRALIESFRPSDRRVIEMPAGITFPLFVRDYLAWTETSGARVYLIFSAPGSRKPIGIIFRRDSLGGGLVTRMCEWCHSYGSAHEVCLLTTARGQQAARGGEPVRRPAVQGEAGGRGGPRRAGTRSSFSESSMSACFASRMRPWASRRSPPPDTGGRSGLTWRNPSLF